MELTIEQALQQGMAAHREGKLEEAERLYKAILQAQPTHFDANHNLGVIAVSVNKVELALPLFKTALEANPKKEQFWLSYIDALIKENQLETAKAVLEKGRELGLVGDKVDTLEAQLKPLMQSAPPELFENKKSLTLKEKRKKIAESKQQKKQAKEKRPNGISPPQSQVDNLLGHYQRGQHDEAEKLALLIIQQFPKHQLGWSVLGAVFAQTGRISEALDANQKLISLSPQDAKAHSNLAVTLQELGRSKEAEASCRRAIMLKPDYVQAHVNLGKTLQELGKLDEAEASYTQAIALKPDFAEAHNNLGATLQELGRLQEAEASCRQAITLKPDFAEAYNNLGHTLTLVSRFEEAEISLRQAILIKPNYGEAYNNLGNTLKELVKLEEAEASYRQAIALTPDYAHSHHNLGITLKALGKLEEAGASYRRAIELKPNFAEAYSNLGRILYELGYEDSALESMEKASDIEPQSKEFLLQLSVMKSRKSCRGSKAAVIDTSKIGALSRLISNPLILNRMVEAELISNLYGMSFMEMDKTKNSVLLASGKDDARYGNGICSPDFNLFEDARSIIQKLAEDLTVIMMEAVKSDIFIIDSFFNILSAGGGLVPHNHMSSLDMDTALGLGKQKYSLVYYLCVGDQNCSEPGILKLYEPRKDILPIEGMIVIIPANRAHSVVYGGKTERVIIGVNFYSI